MVEQVKVFPEAAAAVEAGLPGFPAPVAAVAS